MKRIVIFSLIFLSILLCISCESIGFLPYRMTRDLGIVFGPTYQTKSEAEEACAHNNNAEIVYTDDVIGFLLSPNGGEYLIVEEESGKWRVETILEFERSHAGDSFTDVLGNEKTIILRNVGGRWIGWVEFYDNAEHSCIVNHQVCEQIQGPADRYNPATVYYIFYLDKVSQEETIIVDNYRLSYQDTKWTIHELPLI